MSKPKKIKPNDLRGWTRESLYQALCLDRVKLDATEALLRDERQTNANLRVERTEASVAHQNDMKNMRTEVRRWESCANTFGESLVLALDRIKVLEAQLATEKGS